MRRRRSSRSPATWPATASGASRSGAACARGSLPRRCATTSATRGNWRGSTARRGGAGALLVDGVIDAVPIAFRRRLAELDEALGIEVVEPGELSLGVLA